MCIRDSHQRPGGFDIVILAVSFLADDQWDVGRISLDGIMAVHFDPQLLQPVLKESGAFLAAVFCDHYAAHIETMAFEDGHETQYIHIVGDAQISADLVFLNICLLYTSRCV